MWPAIRPLSATHALNAADPPEPTPTSRVANIAAAIAIKTSATALDLLLDHLYGEAARRTALRSLGVDPASDQRFTGAEPNDALPPVLSTTALATELAGAARMLGVVGARRAVGGRLDVASHADSVLLCQRLHRLSTTSPAGPRCWTRAAIHGTAIRAGNRMRARDSSSSTSARGGDA